MGDTSQHKFQNQENTTMSVMCQNTLGLKHVWDTMGRLQRALQGNRPLNFQITTRTLLEKFDYSIE